MAILLYVWGQRLSYTLQYIIFSTFYFSVHSLKMMVIVYANHLALWYQRIMVLPSDTITAPWYCHACTFCKVFYICYLLTLRSKTMLWLTHQTHEFSKLSMYQDIKEEHNYLEERQTWWFHHSSLWSLFARISEPHISFYLLPLVLGWNTAVDKNTLW